MSEMFGDKRIAVPCPKCGHKITETVGRLEQNPKLTCPACQTVFDVEATEFRKALAAADKAVKDLRRKLGNFGKR